MRYDIAYEVSRLAQYSAAPTQGAIKALKRVLGYLSTTRDRQLMVPRVKGNIWTLYSDSDHAGDMGSGSSRSHTDVIVEWYACTLEKQEAAEDFAEFGRS